MRLILKYISQTQELYNPVRAYQRKDAGNEDEKTRVRMTLLEYGCAAATSTSSENRSVATDEVYNIRKYSLVQETKRKFRCYLLCHILYFMLSCCLFKYYFFFFFLAYSNFWLVVLSLSFILLLCAVRLLNIYFAVWCAEIA